MLPLESETNRFLSKERIHRAGETGSRRMAVGLRRLTFVVLSMIVGSVGAMSQGKAGGKAGKKDAIILPHVRAWQMTQDMTLADTVVVDTIPAEHQIHNPIWRRSLSNVTLGNLGSPSLPTFYPAILRDEGNVFYNALLPIMTGPENFIFYNTKTPYANLTYQKGIPKRRREEFFSALFTQNVNKRLNIGMKLEINAAIGRYLNQAADNNKFLAWGSYDGDYYHAHAAGFYQRFQTEENGGILDDRIVMEPDSFDYDKSEDIPVLFMDARNRLATYRFLYEHSLDIGSVTRTEGDSIEYDVPVATAHHHVYIDRSHHEFKIDTLSTYSEIADSIFPAILVNPDYTKDVRKYMLVRNMFQLKLTEEFNSLLRFGMRLYLENDVRQYYWDDHSTVELDEKGKEYIAFHRNKENRVSTYLGGQLFKNTGEHLFWNAGLRFAAQGYDVGDLKADGNLRLLFGGGRWLTTLWARAEYTLRSPSLWEERYCSNHYEWSHELDREQALTVSGGLKIPGVGLDVTAFSATLNKRVFFNGEGVPTQKSDVTQVVGLYAREHLVSPIGFNSIIRVAVQKTSDNDVVALPGFALYSSMFYEHKFFGVLLTQIGFDVHYNTKFYSPAYIPMVMQFVPQSIRETGGYGYFDPYVNFHLKKIRAYLKYEHINNMWGSNDHFNTIHYPSNPHTFKFGLSWNFYD